MKRAALTALWAIVLTGMAAAQQPALDHYSPADLEQIAQKLKAEAAQKPEGLASQNLQNYGNHFTLLAFRSKTGGAELHQQYADFFFVVDGRATLVTGGKIVDGKSVSEGEIRGSAIESGNRQELGKGDVAHIPANLPHQLLLPPGGTFTYFVVKVHE